MNRAKKQADEIWNSNSTCKFLWERVEKIMEEIATIQSTIRFTPKIKLLVDRREQEIISELEAKGYTITKEAKP